MTSNVEKPDSISQEDWDAVDVPHLTDEQLKQLRPMAEVSPTQYAAQRNLGGRPKAANPKVHVGFRFAADLAARIKEGGAGANGRVETILRQAMDEGRL